MDINPCYWACAQSFDELLGFLVPENDLASQLSSVSLKDELGRLRIWAENAGAHRRGRMSLDYRLREALKVKRQVVNLLEELNNTVRDGKMTPSYETQSKFLLTFLIFQQSPSFLTREFHTMRTNGQPFRLRQMMKTIHVWMKNPTRQNCKSSLSN